MEAPVAIDSSIPEPVFLGLEERKREKLGMDDYMSDGIDVLEIDLDEDGPLREEYLPKRRVSHTGSVRSMKSGTVDAKLHVDHTDWENRDIRMVESEKFLPPPAKWSPAADEPIFRERAKVGQYLAVQPPLTATRFAMSLPQEIRYHNWPVSGNCIPVRQHLTTGYVYDPASVQQLLPAYTSYHYVPPGQSHSRSHSHSCDHENCHPRNLPRSHSQFDYGCDNVRVAANDVVPFCQPAAQWAPARYGCAAPYRQPFGPLPNANFQSTWLRT